MPDVSKVDFVGLQAEKIYIESSDAKLATLGIDPALIINTLQNQNVMISAGDVSTETDRVFLRVSGDFKSVEHLKEIGIRAGGNTFRLGDIGKIYRAYSDPPTTRMRFQGEEAIGLAISMKAGGDIIELGHTHLLVQAVVEAEVPNGPPSPLVRGRTPRARRSLVLTLVALAVIVFLRWQSARERGPELVFTGAEPGPAVATGGGEPAAPGPAAATPTGAPPDSE